MTISATLSRRRGFVMHVVLTCLGCAAVIQTTRQFLVDDWRMAALEEISSTAVFSLESNRSDAEIENVGVAAIFDAGTASKKGLLLNETASDEHSTVDLTAREEGLLVANALDKALIVDASPRIELVSDSDKAIELVSDADKAFMKFQSTAPLRTKVITWEGLDPMVTLIDSSWGGNKFCSTVYVARKNASDFSLPITMNITFGCKELFDLANCGTGNFIFVVYGLRLATQVYDNVGLRFTCSDADATKEELVLPWLTGWFPPKKPNTRSRYPMLTVKEACAEYKKLPIAQMYEEMRYDFRRMAIALVGVPGPDHPSAQFAEKYSSPIGANGSDESISVLQLPVPQRGDDPIFPRGSVELDDAVIHFRCGDLMNLVHDDYGFMKFSGYTKNISPEARSIGILTNPFDAGVPTRKRDNYPLLRDRSRVVVMSFFNYVQERFPKARIRIHNDANETIALTYARMIMANQTIVGISSFGVFPAIGMFGTGYLRRPDYPTAPNSWLLSPPIDKLADNVVLFEEPKRIMVTRIKELWETRGAEGVVEWFWNDTLP